MPPSPRPCVVPQSFPVFARPDEFVEIPEELLISARSSEGKTALGELAKFYGRLTNVQLGRIEALDTFPAAAGSG